MVLWLLSLALMAVAAALVTPAVTMSVSLAALALVSWTVAWVFRAELFHWPKESHDWLLHGIAVGFLGTGLTATAWWGPWVLVSSGFHGLADTAERVAVLLSAAGRVFILWAGVAHLVAAIISARGRGLKSVKRGLFFAVVGFIILVVGGLSMLNFLAEGS